MFHLSTRTSFRLVALACVTAVLFACSDTDERLATRSRRVFGTIPEKMPGSENDTAALIDLGRELYHSNELSLNRTQSCNTCHRIDAGLPGVDHLGKSVGALGRSGSRNSPTVLNAGLHFAQFWDGRARTLAEQAKMPIVNHVEMAMPDAQTVVQRLTAIEPVSTRFRVAFPGEAQPVTFDNIAAAIAAFERTLITTDRFDEFQKGNLQALSAQEKRGLRVFLDTGCASCHQGPLLGGQMFQKLGVVHPYERQNDQGRMSVTKRERDRQVFKVAALRNVGLTAPYFHDGRVGSLQEAVEKMAWLQLGQKLTPQDRDAIVSFLRALSDPRRSAVAKTASR